MKSIKEFGKELVNFLVKLGELAGRKMEDDKMKVIAEKKQSVYRFSNLICGLPCVVIPFYSNIPITMFYPRNIYEPQTKI